MKKVHLLLLALTLLLAACGNQEIVLTEPPTATATPVFTQQPTRTPLGMPTVLLPVAASPSPIIISQPTVISQPAIVFQPTAIFQPPVVFQPTAAFPATVVGSQPIFVPNAPVV